MPFSAATPAPPAKASAAHCLRRVDDVPVRRDRRAAAQVSLLPVPGPRSRSGSGRGAAAVDLGFVDVGAVVGVVRQQLVVGRDRRPCCRRRSFRRRGPRRSRPGASSTELRRVADVHVEVPVAVAFAVGVDRASPTRIREPSSEMSSSATSPPVIVVPVGSGRDDLGGAGRRGCGRRSSRRRRRRRARISPSEPKTKWVPSSEKRLADAAAKGRRPGSRSPGHALDEGAVGKPQRDVGRAVGEAGIADALRRRRRRSRGRRRCRAAASRRRRSAMPSAGRPTYSVVHPLLRVAGRDVWVGPEVGRVAGDPGDRRRSGASRAAGRWRSRVARRAGSARDQVGVDVVAAGVRRRDELVGAAVEQQARHRVCWRTWALGQSSVPGSAGRS